MTILDTIDNAIGDHETSMDAMRWTPEPQPPDIPSGRLALEWCRQTAAMLRSPGVTVSCTPTITFTDRDGHEEGLPVLGYNLYGSSDGVQHQLIAHLERVHFWGVLTADVGTAPVRRRPPHISRMHFRYAKRRR